MTDPIPVGSVVFYYGSHSEEDNRRYVVTGHDRPGCFVSDPEVNYPDGVAYTIWPEGMPRKFGLREHMISQVRRQSLELTGFTPRMTEDEAILELVDVVRRVLASDLLITKREQQALDLLSERYE